MAKYKANMTFNGYAENKLFQEGEEFEMTIKRANEVETTIQKTFPSFKLTRLDVK